MSYIQPANHIPFILKSETEIIKEAFRSLDATNGGIETYPICDYLLHSLFLRLTGAQEQKLKCICWEMACRDYEYRYERYERKPYGECSSYDDKCMVYNDLLNEIKKLDESFTVTDTIKDEILDDWRVSIQQVFENSLLAQNFKKSYDEYKVLVANVRKKTIAQNWKGKLLVDWYCKNCLRTMSIRNVIVVLTIHVLINTTCLQSRK